jgi:hypothetical protein
MALFHIKRLKIPLKPAINFMTKLEYCLVRKSNHPFLVLKGVTEMSFLVLKRISGNSEEN